MPLPNLASRQAAPSFCLCLLLTIGVFLSGCDGLTYAPSGENRVEVDPAPAPEIAVPLADTMDVWGRSTITYDADLKQDAFRTAYLVINGEQYGESISRGRLTLETGRFGDGTYPFDLVIVTRRGGSTLAAQVGATTTTTLFSGVLHVVNDVDPALNSVTASVREGALRISWTPTPTSPPGFESYVVERRATCCTNEWQVVDRIEDPRETFVDDTEYTGGPIRYRVEMRARGTFDSGEVEGTFVSPLEATLQTNGTEATVTWEPTPLTRSFRSYVVQRRLVREEKSHTDVPWLTVDTLDDVNETAFRETLDVFGGEFEYRVVNTSTILSDDAVASAPTSATFRPPRDTVTWGGLDLGERYLPALDAYIKNNDDDGTTRLFDRASKELRLEKKLPVRVSERTSRAHAFSPDGARWYRGVDTLRVIEYDVETLSRVKTYDLKSFIPEVYHSTRSPYLTVSNSGRLFVGLNAYRSPTNYINRGLGIFDVSGDEPVLNDLFDLYVDSYLISRYFVEVRRVWASGNHAYLNVESQDVNHISAYRIEADTAVAVNTTAPPEYVFTRNGVDYYAHFNPRGFEETGLLSAYRVSDTQKVWEIEIAPGITSLQFDRGTGYFGSIVRKISGDISFFPTELLGPSSYLIYSLQDGLVRDVPAVYGESYTLSGGVLWNENAYLDLFDPTQ